MSNITQFSNQQPQQQQKQEEQEFQYTKEQTQRIIGLLNFQLNCTLNKKVQSELETKKYSIFFNYPFEDYPSLKYSYLSIIQFPACVREAKQHLQYNYQNNNSEHQCFNTFGDVFSYLYLIPQNCLKFNQGINYYVKLSTEFQQSIYTIYQKFNQVIKSQYYLYSIQSQRELEFIIKKFNPFGKFISNVQMPCKEQMDITLSVLNQLSEETQVQLLTSLLIDTGKVKFNKQSEIIDKKFQIDLFKLNQKHFHHFSNTVRDAAFKELGVEYVKTMTRQILQKQREKEEYNDVLQQEESQLLQQMFENK